MSNKNKNTLKHIANTTKRIEAQKGKLQNTFFSSEKRNEKKNEKKSEKKNDNNYESTSEKTNIKESEIDSENQNNKNDQNSQNNQNDQNVELANVITEEAIHEEQNDTLNSLETDNVTKNYPQFFYENEVADTIKDNKNNKDVTAFQCLNMYENEKDINSTINRSVDIINNSISNIKNNLVNMKKIVASKKEEEEEEDEEEEEEEKEEKEEEEKDENDDKDNDNDNEEKERKGPRGDDGEKQKTKQKEYMKKGGKWGEETDKEQTLNELEKATANESDSINSISSDNSSIVMTFENQADDQSVKSKTEEEINLLLKTVINTKKVEKHFTTLDIVDECISIGNTHNENKNTQNKNTTNADSINIASTNKSGLSGKWLKPSASNENEENEITQEKEHGESQEKERGHEKKTKMEDGNKQEKEKYTEKKKEREKEKTLSLNQTEQNNSFLKTSEEKKTYTTRRENINKTNSSTGGSSSNIWTTSVPVDNEKASVKNVQVWKEREGKDEINEHSFHKDKNHFASFQFLLRVLLYLTFFKCFCIKTVQKLLGISEKNENDVNKCDTRKRKGKEKWGWKWKEKGKGKGKGKGKAKGKAKDGSLSNAKDAAQRGDIKLSHFTNISDIKNLLSIIKKYKSIAVLFLSTFSLFYYFIIIPLNTCFKRIIYHIVYDQDL